MPPLPLSLLQTSPSKFQASNTETLSLELRTTSFRLPRPPICLLLLRPSDSPLQTCRTELSTPKLSVTRINLISKKTLAILTTTKDRFRITLRLLKELLTDLTHSRKVMTTWTTRKILTVLLSLRCAISMPTHPPLWMSASQFSKISRPQWTTDGSGHRRLVLHLQTFHLSITTSLREPKTLSVTTMIWRTNTSQSHVWKHTHHTEETNEKISRCVNA